MRISDHIAAHVENLVNVHALSEPITYEIIPTMKPTPQGPRAVWVLMLVGRSIALNEAVGAPLITIERPDISEEQLKPHVLKAIAAIKTAKAAAASTPPAQARPKPNRTASGLYLN
ncbi:hypothetical protein [Acrocarpospora sp. B8E8]|uniref:hypothetical protein n=1 Tax=Acrocarpospora sp. B8E8 TaxID=3153572 RepID=UPI00325DF334